MIKRQQAVLVLATTALILGVHGRGLAALFEHRLNTPADFTMYLDSVENARLHHEHWGPNWHVDYWAPTQPNVWGRITYRYDLPFRIETAILSVNVYAAHIFDPGAEGFAEVSRDGSTWVRVATLAPQAPPPIASSTAGDRDLSTLLAGATVVYLRGQIRQRRATTGSFRVAQFARTHFPFPGDPGYAGISFRATGSSTAIPEPAAWITWGGLIGIFGFVSALLHRRRRPQPRWPSPNHA